MKRHRIISREELARIKEMADDYLSPKHPREGWQTVAAYDHLQDIVMRNLYDLLEAARRGVSR